MSVGAGRHDPASAASAARGMVRSPIDKNRPDDTWIAALRQRFPVETEIDRVLTRKLENRSGPGYLPQSLQMLVDGAASLIAARHDGPFELLTPRWLSGGASKLQMAFVLRWSPGGGAVRETPMVLRMEPAASVCETSRQREFELLQAMQGVVPCPQPWWVDADGSHLAYPALIYGFAEGVTKPSSTTSNVSGLGTNLGPDFRHRLAPEFMTQFAAIHRHPVDDPRLVHFDTPSLPTQPAEWALNWWERVWEEDCGDDVPLMRLAAAWMRSHLPATDRLSILHGDYRTGNFLFDEREARITAWLDWELGHIGDRHEDLGWSLSTAFGHSAEAGGDFLVCGLLPERAFLDAYTAASGLAVDMTTLHFYRVLSAYKAIAIVLAAGYRNARNGKSHQDVLLVWLMGLAAPLMSELATLLEAG
jgi:aminoglycoside phosphotransferase (APT) family kinase protein